MWRWRYARAAGVAKRSAVGRRQRPRARTVLALYLVVVCALALLTVVAGDRSATWPTDKADQESTVPRLGLALAIVAHKAGSSAFEHLLRRIMKSEAAAAGRAFQRCYHFETQRVLTDDSALQAQLAKRCPGGHTVFSRDSTYWGVDKAATDITPVAQYLRRTDESCAVIVQVCLALARGPRRHRGSGGLTSKHILIPRVLYVIATPAIWRCPHVVCCRICTDPPPFPVVVARYAIHLIRWFLCSILIREYIH